MKQTPALEQKIERSLDLSWKEGIPGSVMLGILDNYLVPLGLFLKATTQQIGFLVAIPHLLASFSLLLSVQAVRRVGSRGRFIVRAALLQAALLLPVAALALTPIPGRVGILVLLMIAYRVLLNLIGPAWGSLMSDYLPPEKRGQYFGARAQAVGIAQLTAIAVAGVILSFTKDKAPAVGFLLVFLIAAIARFISAALLSRLADPPLHAVEGSDFTFTMFLRRFRESNFVKFTFYVASITFSTFLAAPYFSVTMLRDLHFSYLAYMSVHLGMALAGIVSFPIWGRHADLVGNARVLKTTSLLVPIIPFLWLFSGHPVYLTLVEMFAGFAWGGFNLCAANFIYDAVSPEKRVRCLGYFNLINGMAIFLGTNLGGFLGERLPPLMGSPLLSLFLLSGSLRFLSHFVLSRHFEEVRASGKPVSSLKLFFSVVGIKPLSSD